MEQENSTFNSNDENSDTLTQKQDLETSNDITNESDISLSEGSSKNLPSVPYHQTKLLPNLKKQFMTEVSQDAEEENTKIQMVEQSPKGRFKRFNQELGRGSQKTVYMCYDYDAGRECAWNVINVGTMGEEAIIKVREEINLMKKLNHPNIISFISGFYNEKEKEVIIITEIFNGGSLKKHLKKYGNPILRVIKQWCIEILKGLKYLHEQPHPIIHRDIKCDNIFINNITRNVKIGDLGFSCVLKSKDYAKSFNGTIEFCSPEVFLGKYGVKADIYSFGMTVLEMVTGERPYKECQGSIIKICEKTTKMIMPLSLEKIRNNNLKDFIKLCLQPENARPMADELLRSKFLNDLNSEENNYTALNYPPEKKTTDVKEKHNENKSPKKKRNSPKKGLGKIEGISLKLKEEDKGKEKEFKEYVTFQLRHKSNKSSKAYNIEFAFNLINDTPEGVTMEMQREINMSNREREEIQRKMEKILDEYLEQNQKEFVKYYKIFTEKWEKISKEAEDIIKNIKEMKDISESEKEEYWNNLKILEEFVKSDN